MKKSLKKKKILLITFFALFAVLRGTLCQTQTDSTTSPSPESMTSSCTAGNSSCPDNNENTISPVENATLPSLSTSSVATSLSSEISKSTAAKTSPSLETSTSIPPSTTPIATTTSPAPPTRGQKDVLPVDGNCPCNILANVCDINCCCDTDCSKVERKAFSDCFSRKIPTLDAHYCYSSNLVFRNNTEHILEEFHGGVFCIVRSNLAGSMSFPDKNTITSEQDFNRQWKRAKILEWRISTPKDNKAFNASEKYTAGSPVWSFRNQKLVQLDLPSSGLTLACSSTKLVKYLEPFSGSCIQKTPADHLECTAVGSFHYRQLLNIIKSPIALNNSQLIMQPPDICPRNICTSVNIFHCVNSSNAVLFPQNCQEVLNPDALFHFNATSRICHGVVEEMRYIFYHNGTEGIRNLNAYVWLTNLSLPLNDSSANSLRQKFLVDFRWTPRIAPDRNTSANATSRSVMFERSGNPGYIVGKPLIAGFKVKSGGPVSTAKKTSVHAGEPAKGAKHIIFSEDKRDWLTLPGSLNGVCDWTGNTRQEVPFGIDMHFSCGASLLQANFSSSTACNAMRTHMVRLLLGSSANILLNISETSQWGRVVAAFGDANVSAVNDWVSVLVENLPANVLRTEVSTLPSAPASQRLTSQSVPAINSSSYHICENIPLGLEIRVMHSLFGSMLEPQSKIVGTSLRFTPVRDLSWECLASPCPSKKVAIVSSTVFVDVSSPAVTRFAEPPAIHIRLPSDFFYPFMTFGESASASLRGNLILCCLALKLCFIFCTAA